MRAFGRVRLLQTADGGLEKPVPTPTPSILVRVDCGPGAGDVGFGARIFTPDDVPLTPGAEVEIELEFWAELADVHLQPGTEFRLQYPPSRQVGSGAVDGIHPLPMP